MLEPLLLGSAVLLGELLDHAIQKSGAVINWREVQRGQSTAAALQSIHILDNDADPMLQVFSWLASCRGTSHTVHVVG